MTVRATRALGPPAKHLGVLREGGRAPERWCRGVLPGAPVFSQRSQSFHLRCHSAPSRRPLHLLHVQAGCMVPAAVRRPHVQGLVHILMCKYADHGGVRVVVVVVVVSWSMDESRHLDRPPLESWLVREVRVVVDVVHVTDPVGQVHVVVVAVGLPAAGSLREPPFWFVGKVPALVPVGLEPLVHVEESRPLPFVLAEPAFSARSKPSPPWSGFFERKAGRPGAAPVPVVRAEAAAVSPALSRFVNPLAQPVLACLKLGWFLLLREEHRCREGCGELCHDADPRSPKLRSFNINS